MAADSRRDSSPSNDRSDETHTPARGAAGERPAPGGEETRRDPTREASGAALRRQMADPTIESVTTMVCVLCGNERFFDGPVPAGLSCFCGSSVFRAFDTPTRRDEATIAHLEEEARSIQLGDASPQTSPDEVRDLDMR